MSSERLQSIVYAAAAAPRDLLSKSCEAVERPCTMGFGPALFDPFNHPVSAMTSANYSAWLDQLLDNLSSSGPEAAEALQFVRRHRTKVGVHDQLTGARWTIGRRIELHPSYLQGSPADPHALSLVIHEVRHLQQGALVALSVYGELEAWQLQFAFLKSATGYYQNDPRRNRIIEELMSLSPGWARSALENARELMQSYAGKAYRIDLLPLFPLPAEILYRATGKCPTKPRIYRS